MSGPHPELPPAVVARLSAGDRVDVRERRAGGLVRKRRWQIDDLLCGGDGSVYEPTLVLVHAPSGERRAVSLAEALTSRDFRWLRAGGDR